MSDETSDGLLAGLDQVRSARVILACGDLPFGYLGALADALEVPLVFVPGNHDPDLSGYRVSRAGLTLRAGMPARAPWPDGAVSADGRIVEVAGLRIGGLGGCLRYGDGPNQYTERQQAWRALRLRGAARRRSLRRAGRGIDVLLTHAPPRGVGDGDDAAHRGFWALHGLTRALRPAALLHGHVHPYGQRTEPGKLHGAAVLNVTGWHLLDIRPGAGLAELLPGRVGSWGRDAS